MRRLCSLALSAVMATGCGLDDGLEPNPVGNDGVPAPEKSVDFVVDGLGITHVYAQSDADAFFGAGYAMARDRLFQMEMARRGAKGTSAEVRGQDGLADDIVARTMNFARLGAADAARTLAERPDDYALAAAWTAGVNRRIVEIAQGIAPRPFGLGPNELDFVPDPFLVEDGFAIGKTLAFGISNSLDSEILATALTRLVPDTLANLSMLMPAYDAFAVPSAESPSMMQKPPSGPPSPPTGSPPGAPPPPSWIAHRAAPPFASNNWAVDGAHTQTGKPLLCGDPHQELTSPTRLWPVHMQSVDGGGSLDVIGFGFVGTPTIELGMNARVGWTATTNQADVMDLWDAVVDPEYASVSLGGVARPLTTRHEEIQIRKDGAPFGTNGEPFELDLRESHDFGVMLPDEILPVPRALLADHRLFFDWVGFRATLESSAYIALDRATDLDAFERAADLLDVGAVNFVAADASGIDYRAHAAVPDRGDPKTHPMPWRAVSGDDAMSLWTRGDLSPDKLPHARNPARGYLVTANNDPFGFTADGDVENDPYYYGAIYDKGFRAHRIETALAALVAGGKKIARSDMEALQADVKSSMAETLIPHLDDAVQAVSTDPALQQFLGRTDLEELAARFHAWDGRFSEEQADPVAFLAFEWFLTQRMLEAPLTPTLFRPIADVSPPFLLGTVRNVVEHRIPNADVFLPEGIRPLLLHALDDTSTWLLAAFGSIDASAYSLGALQSAAFAPAYPGLEVSSVSVSGSADTVDVAATPFFDDSDAPLGALTVTTKSLYRMAMEFDDDGTPNATIDFALGTRGDPSDPHFADQQATWASAGHLPLPFRKADVDASATERTTIAGRAGP